MNTNQYLPTVPFNSNIGTLSVTDFGRYLNIETSEAKALLQALFQEGNVVSSAKHWTSPYFVRNAALYLSNLAAVVNTEMAAYDAEEPSQAEVTEAIDALVASITEADEDDDSYLEELTEAVNSWEAQEAAERAAITPKRMAEIEEMAMDVALATQTHLYDDAIDSLTQVERTVFNELVSALMEGDDGIDIEAETAAALEAEKPELYQLTPEEEAIIEDLKKMAKADRAAGDDGDAGEDEEEADGGNYLVGAMSSEEVGAFLKDLVVPGVKGTPCRPMVEKLHSVKASNRKAFRRQVRKAFTTLDLPWTIKRSIYLVQDEDAIWMIGWDPSVKLIVSEEIVMNPARLEAHG